MQKQTRYDDKKLLAIFQKFAEIGNLIQNEHNREAISHMIETVGTSFFEAPASGRLEYHNCFPGGLCAHSLNVYSIFKKLTDMYGKEFAHDDVIIAALFHDLGKIGHNGVPYYIPKDSEWHKEKMGLYYETNPALRYMPHAQRSLQILADFDVELSTDVYTAILIHDGQYVPENKPYAMKEGRFALLLSMADRLACEIEKDAWMAIQ